MCSQEKPVERMSGKERQRIIIGAGLQRGRRRCSLAWKREAGGGK